MQKERSGSIGASTKLALTCWSVSVAELAIALLALLVYHSTFTAKADDCPTARDEISTDRPDVTNSSLVVPAGSLRGQQGRPEVVLKSIYEDAARLSWNHQRSSNAASMISVGRPRSIRVSSGSAGINRTAGRSSQIGLHQRYRYRLRSLADLAASVGIATCASLEDRVQETGDSRESILVFRCRLERDAGANTHRGIESFDRSLGRIGQAVPT
jgi:hypothetical protein